MELHGDAPIELGPTSSIVQYLLDVRFLERSTYKYLHNQLRFGSLEQLPAIGTSLAATPDSLMLPTYCPLAYVLASKELLCWGVGVGNSFALFLH
jgi:hypothetical protein